jgi:hypothetical protein
MGLEPLSWTLAGWTPPQLWETGMVLWLIGIGLFGSAGIAAGGFARKTGSLMVVAAIPLLAWLVADAPSVREVVVNSLRAANEGLYESIAASVSFRDVSDGWFTSRFLVAGPGVILGIAWLALGRDQLRGAGHGHVPDASESLQSA